MIQTAWLPYQTQSRVNYLRLKCRPRKTGLRPFRFKTNRRAEIQKLIDRNKNFSVDGAVLALVKRRYGFGERTFLGDKDVNSFLFQ